MFIPQKLHRSQNSVADCLAKYSRSEWATAVWLDIGPACIEELFQRIVTLHWWNKHLLISPKKKGMRNPVFSPPKSVTHPKNERFYATQWLCFHESSAQLRKQAATLHLSPSRFRNQDPGWSIHIGTANLILLGSKAVQCVLLSCFMMKTLPVRCCESDIVPHRNSSPLPRV